jgi:ADP-heptose:LPS heptosyltransferase
LLNESNLLQSDKEFFCFHIGGSTAHKRWPAKKYALLAEQVYEKYRVRVAFVGSTGELDLLRDVTLGEKSTVNLISNTNILELLNIVRKSKLVVANDSAVGHISAFWGVPTLTIYGGPSNENIFKPSGEGITQIIRPNCICKSSEQDRCSNPNDWCLGTVSVNMVMKEISKICDSI